MGEMTKILQGQPVLKSGLEPGATEKKVQRCSNYRNICQSDNKGDEEAEEEEGSISRKQTEGQNVYLTEGILSGSIVNIKNKMPFNLRLLTSCDNIQLDKNRNSKKCTSLPKRRVLLDKPIVL
jgi:hypothetical protein